MHNNNQYIPARRFAIVDVLRGWALLSVVMMNYLAIYSWNHHLTETIPGSLNYYIETTCEFIFGSKGWTLLAVLFGFGFSAILNKGSVHNLSASLLFARRMVWLLVVAAINTIFFGGDILTDYALMGLLLLFFYKLKARQLFGVALAILLLTPMLHAYLGANHLLFAPALRDKFYALYDRNHFFDHIRANFIMRYQWMLRLSYSVILHLIQLGCMLLGAAIYRSKRLAQWNHSSKNMQQFFLVSLVCSLLLTFLQWMIDYHAWSFNDYYNLFYPHVILTMCATTSAIAWLYLTGRGSKFFDLLIALGKTTLSNYIIQNIIGFVMLMLLKPEWPLYYYLLLAVAVYTAQLFASKWWMKRFNYGIAEFCWRSLADGQSIPFKRTITANKLAITHDLPNASNL